MTNAAALTDLENLLQKRLSRSASDRNLHGRSESHFSLMPPDAVAYVELVAYILKDSLISTDYTTCSNKDVVVSILDIDSS